jgi:methylmalonyl-CoA mutase N-terminal domain/subunit
VSKYFEKKREWEELFKKTTERSPERKEKFLTPSGIELKPLYSPEDLEEIKYTEEIGFPGLFPFTRGVYPTMYRGRIWTMRQYAGFGTAEETNKRFKYLLKQGQTGLSVAFDLPTQMGYDSDHPMARGEVGRVGVAIDSLKDMEILFDGIPLDRVSTSMTINATAMILLAMYIAVGEKQGVPHEKLRGTIQNDILKEYIARGTYIFPPEPSLKIITDIFEYAKDELPNFNTISISGYHIREAGANAVQEVAFTISNGIEYVKAAIKAGLKVDDFAPRLSFFFNVHNNFFEEIAKFRAARRLWAEIMREKFGATDPASLMLRFHTQTAGSTLTAQQIENNIIRVTIQALAAVLGGTQSLHTNSMDEALSLPSEDAVRVALRTQQIIAYESGVADTIDPLGGSYFLESLTKEIYSRVKTYLEKIENMGGMVKAIENGYVQQEIEKSSYEYQLAVENKKQIVVGVNEFCLEERRGIENILRIDPEVERRQIEKLQILKKERNEDEVKKSLKGLEEAVAEGKNIMPYILSAVKSYCTLGEIVGVLERKFGRYKR